MLTRRFWIAGLTAALSSIGLVGCMSEVSSTEEDEIEDTFFDGKGDRAGLIDHSSSLQSIHEIGVPFTSTMRAHAWKITLGTHESVSIYTALFSGDHGPEVDTVLYLYQQQANGEWGHYIRKNNNTQGTKWSRIEADLEPGVYRVIVSAASSNVNGDFAVNFECEDGRCDYYAPSNGDEPEEPGVGTPDEPRRGTVSFEVPLQTEDGTLLSSFNEQLRAAGFEEFPDRVTVSSGSRTPSAEYDHFAELAAREDVLAVTDAELLMYEDPDAYLDNGFCYRGVSSQLADFTAGFSDGIFSDQYIVAGWRAGVLSAYGEWHEPTESSGDLDEWNEFDASSGEVMIVFSTDDNGTSRFTSVPRCR